MSKTRLSKEYKRQNRKPAPKGKLGQTSSGKPKKHKGRPAGKRNTSPDTQDTASNSGKRSDPRIGSRKPIPLKANTSAQEARIEQPLSPQAELNAIENDDKLNKLLDKAEQDRPLTRNEKTYMQAQLNRHAELCEQLGIDAGPPEEASGEDALLDKLDASPLDEFKAE